MRFSPGGSCWAELDETVGKDARGLVKILIAENIHALSVRIGESGAERIMRRKPYRISESVVNSIARDVETEVIQSLKRIPWKSNSRMIARSSLDLLCDSMIQCCFRQ